MDHLLKGNVEIKRVLYDTLDGSRYIAIFICRVGVKIRVRVKGVKRIPVDARRDHYAIEVIFTSANMTMMELDK